jgi:cytochrome c oxidase subunit IV
MTDNSHSHDHESHADVSHALANHGGNGKYLVVFAALCILTTGSFLTYFPFWRHHVPFQASRALMMAISCTKAMLVIMFFMHLLWEANWKWVLTIPATFMSVFLMFMLVPDIGWRINNGYARYSEQRWLYAANRPAVEASDLKAAEKDLSHDEAP